MSLLNSLVSLEFIAIARKSTTPPRDARYPRNVSECVSKYHRNAISCYLPRRVLHARYLPYLLYVKHNRIRRVVDRMHEFARTCGR